MLASGPTSASASPPRAAQSPRSRASACAWPIEDSYLTANSGLPDTAAWYWGQSFTVHQGTQVVGSGVYPDARYASFTVYSSGELPFTSNGVVSTHHGRKPRVGSAAPGLHLAHHGDPPTRSPDHYDDAGNDPILWSRQPPRSAPVLPGRVPDLLRQS